MLELEKRPQFRLSTNKFSINYMNVFTICGLSKKVYKPYLNGQ